MQKRTKIALFGLSGLLFGLLVLLGSFYGYLRSPSGSRFILSQMKIKLLEKSNIKMEYSAGSIDPFSFLHFENLKILKQIEGETVTEVNIRLLDIRYQISFFSRMIDFEKIQVDEPTIFIHSLKKDQQSKAGPSPLTTPPSQFPETQSFAVPSFQVLVRQLDLKALNIDVDTWLSGKHLKAHVVDANIQFGLNWVQKNLTSFARGNVREIQYSQSDTDTDSLFHLNHLELNSNLQLEAKSNEIFNLSKHFFQSCDSKQILKSDSMKFSWREGQKKDSFRLGPQLVQINTDCQSGLTSHFSFEARDLFSDTYSRKMALMNANMTIKLPQDLKKLQAFGEAQVNQKPLMKFDVETDLQSSSQTGGLSFQGSPLRGKMNWRVNSSLGQVFFLGDSFSQIDPFEADLSFEIKQEKDLIQLGAQATIPQFSSHQFSNQTGKWNIETQMKAQIQMPLKKGVTFLQGGVLQSTLSTRLSQNESSVLKQDGSKRDGSKQDVLKQGFYRVQEPISIQSKVTLDHGRTQVEMDGKIPILDILQKAQIKNTQVLAKISSPDLVQAKEFEVDLELHQGEIQVDLVKTGFLKSSHLSSAVGATQLSKTPKTSKLFKTDGETFLVLAGANARLKASTQGNQRFDLGELFGELNLLPNQPLIQLTAEATGNTQTRNYQSKGKMTVELLENFPKMAGQSLHGRMEFPWTLFITRGKEINLSGFIDLFRLNWVKGPLRVQNLSGRIPVSEQLILKGMDPVRNNKVARREPLEVQFSYLIHQNPFERVDYDRLQPMIHSTEVLGIEKIGFEEKNYGPFQGFFSIQQNILFAHRFDLKLGSGRSNGEMYLNAYPSNLQVGILSRLTGLNLSEVLPQKYMAQNSNEEKTLSGRMGVVVNLNRGVIDGRIDATEVGRQQLMTMINLMDPKYLDEQMNRARFALGIAYPTKVEMAFQNGYLDMAIGLGGALSYVFNLRGIPVSSWISGASADWVKKTKEGPLK